MDGNKWNKKLIHNTEGSQGKFCEQTNSETSAKNEIGRLSMCILDYINSRLRKSLGVNPWKFKMEVIHWFEAIEKQESA